MIVKAMSHFPSRRALLQAALSSAVPLWAAPNDGMFLALNSVLVNNRVKWPAFPELAAQSGFHGVDIMLRPAMEAGADKTLDLLKKLRLRPASIDFPVKFDKDQALFERGLAELDAHAKFAADIGCPRMNTAVLASSDTPRDEMRERLRKRFTQCAEVMGRYDVRLALEFLGPLQFRKAKHEFIWRMNDMLAFTEECGKNVGLLLDAWHWRHAGATTDDIIKAGDRIVHVHFDDAPDLPPEQIRDNERLLPGEGVIDLVGFLKALKKIEYKNALSVEVFGRLNNETPEMAARKGYEAAAAVLKKAGIPT